MKNDDAILAKLRHNSKKSISDIAKELGMPTSTVFDKIKRLNDKGVIKRYTALIDYLKAGFGHVANLKVLVRKENKENVKQFLLQNKNINSLHEADNGYFFIIETIHKSMKEYVEFRENLKLDFDVDIKSESIILDSLKREGFMSLK